MALSEITPEQLGGFSELLDEEYYEVLASGSWLDSKLSAGGTSASSLEAQLERSASALASAMRRLTGPARSSAGLLRP